MRVVAKRGANTMDHNTDAEWREASEEVIAGMTEWRGQHPKATLREIEAALDERLARLRAKMLRDSALASTAADWRTAGAEEMLKCPRCGGVLRVGGAQSRTLQTQGGQEIVLTRQYGVCPECGESFFPPG
jgi:YgiT-type zinc finger domain-containing protein